MTLIGHRLRVRHVLMRAGKMSHVRSQQAEALSRLPDRRVIRETHQRRHVAGKGRHLNDRRQRVAASHLVATINPPGDRNRRFARNRITRGCPQLGSANLLCRLTEGMRRINLEKRMLCYSCLICTHVRSKLCARSGNHRHGGTHFR